MDDILPVLPWREIIVFWFECHWTAFLGAQLITNQHYLSNGCTPNKQSAIFWSKDDIVHWGVIRPQWYDWRSFTRKSGFITHPFNSDFHLTARIATKVFTFHDSCTVLSSYQCNQNALSALNYKLKISWAECFPPLWVAAGAPWQSNHPSVSESKLNLDMVKISHYATATKPEPRANNFNALYLRF